MNTSTVDINILKKKKQQQIRMCPLDFCGVIQDSAVKNPCFQPLYI